MEIRVKTGAIEQHPADAIIVNLFDDKRIGGATQAVDQALNGAVSALVEGGDFGGKPGEVAVIYPRGAIPARRVIVVGLGKRAEFSVETVRRAAGAAAIKARDLGAKVIGTIVQGAGAAGLAPDAAAQAVVEGSLLALYQWRGLKSGADDLKPQPDALELVARPGADTAPVEAGARAGQAVAEATALARDLVNNPPNVATPTMLAETARQIAARFGMRVQVLGRADMEALGMGSFLGVARGTEEPPTFTILEHNPDAATTIVLVGKGITFDTGGISLKPGENMETMKSDMAGAAAVLGAVQAAGALNLPLHVVGLVPATDNMPSGRAYKPADVLKAMNGKTIEVITTDAEGRLILADALCYAAHFQPAAVVDLATLTGACVVALGAGMAAGLFCDDEKLRARLLAAAEATHERVWHLPLFPEYLDAIKSDTADIKNAAGRMAGVGTSAMFLKQFAEGYPWAHLDIAGMAGVMMGGDKPSPVPYQPKGASGFGVRLLVEMLRRWS